MNAGAYGGEMKDVLRKVMVMDQSGKVFRFRQKNFRWDMNEHHKNSRIYCPGCGALS